MFYKGDKIVYPIYGGGIVEDIEQNETGKYYIISILFGGLKIKLSVLKAENIGIRKVSPQSEIIDTIKKVVSNTNINIDKSYSENWNHRYKQNFKKIKTGKLLEVAEVFKILKLKEKEKKLSDIEKKMLNNTKQIIISEIILSNNIVKEKAEELLANLLISC